MSGPAAKQRFECREGAASIEHRAATVLLIEMSGSVDAAVGRRVATALSTALAASPAPVASFWDLERMTHYDSDVRVLCTQSLVRNWAAVRELRTLATNRVVKMGVAVANVALRGRITNTESRPEFERCLAQAVAASARPSPG